MGGGYGGRWGVVDLMGGVSAIMWWRGVGAIVSYVEVGGRSVGNTQCCHMLGTTRGAGGRGVHYAISYTGRK